MLLGKSRFLKPAYSIFLYMTGVKYKWQLQFVNKEGEWQEFDSFQNKSEAQEVQTQYEVKHNKHCRIINFEESMVFGSDHDM